MQCGPHLNPKGPSLSKHHMPASPKAALVSITARLLSSLSGGEAGWTLTSCLCRDAGWGLTASPCSSALALLPRILGICSEFIPSSHLFFLLQLSGSVGTWMTVSSRYEPRLTDMLHADAVGAFGQMLVTHIHIWGGEGLPQCPIFCPMSVLPTLEWPDVPAAVHPASGCHWEPHRAFTLYVYSKPRCTSPSPVFRCKNKSPT